MLDKKLLPMLLLSLLLAQTAAAAVEMVESDAFIKNNELQVKMLFSNSGSQQRSVTININYLGQVDSVAEPVPANSTKLLTYKISNIKPGEVRFAVISDENTFIKIVVPEDVASRDVLLVHEISAEEWKRNLPGEGPFSKLVVAFNHLLASPDAVAVATVLLIAAALLLVVKVIFRKKTAAEKKVGMTEELLKEAEQIEEKRGRVEKKFKL